MDPESTFGDVGAMDWAARLCVLLIKHQPRIEESLKADHYAGFQDGIARWQADYLGKRQPVEKSARFLYAVCAEHGVIELMESLGLLTAGEPVRTRGAAGVSRRPDFHGVARAYIRRG